MVRPPARATTLDTKVYDEADHLKIGDKIRIRFPDREGKINLSLFITDEPDRFLFKGAGNYLLELMMPWGERYYIGRYKKEEQARTAFNHYNSTLERGCTITIDTKSRTGVIFSPPL